MIPSRRQKAIFWKATMHVVVERISYISLLMDVRTCMQVTAAVITEENFHDVVQIASTGCGDGSVLIEVLRQVWAPTLRSSGLSTSCLKKLEENLLSSGFSTTVAEEQDFWRKRRDEVKRSHERTICEEAERSVRNIRAELDNAAVSRCTKSFYPHGHQMTMIINDQHGLKYLLSPCNAELDDEIYKLFSAQISPIF